MKEKSSSLF